MKTIKLNTVFLLVFMASFIKVSAQIPNSAVREIEDLNIFDAFRDDYPEESYGDFLIHTGEMFEIGCIENTECWWNSISISFEGSGGVNFHQNEINRLENYARTVEANIQAFQNWISRQHAIIENEIERQLGASFSDYETAQDAYYEVKEQTLLEENISGYNSFIGDSPQSLKSEYSGKIATKAQVRKEAVRKMKLVDFWKGLIASGEASISQYGHLKYGDIPLNTLTDLSQLQAFVANEETVFGDNEWRLETDKLIKSKILEIGNGVANREPAGYYNEVRELYRAQYNRYDQFDQINLMQLYLTDPMELMEFHRMLSVYESEAVRNDPLYIGRQHDWVSPIYIGASHVEDYAERNFGSLPYAFRVFDPDYFLERTRSLGLGGIGRLIEEINNAKAAHINAAKDALSLDEMLLETCFDNIGADNRNFVEANDQLKSAVAGYFQINDYFKPAVDCVHYLINQYRNDQDFSPDTNYYISSPETVFTYNGRRGSIRVDINSSPQTTALAVRMTDEAITDGFRDFGHVLEALYANNVAVGKEGQVMRDYFEANGIPVPSGLSNETLGRYFYFEAVNYGTESILRIRYNGVIGLELSQLGISLEEYLSILVNGQINTYMNDLILYQDKPIVFATLWENFEIIKGTHLDPALKRDPFSNYCAINLSNALLKSGVDLDTYNGVKCWGCLAIENNSEHAIRAAELANWLKNSSVQGIGSPVSLNGENFKDYISGKKGIVYFEDYWQREGQSERTGDHIDLWDGNEMASSSWFGTQFRLMFPDIAESLFNTSSLYKSRIVLFWEIE